MKRRTLQRSSIPFILVLALAACSDEGEDTSPDLPPTGGAAGASGNAGSSGTSGSAGGGATGGSSGTAGTAGASGTSGSSGANGTAGSSGTAGTAGTSGTAGSTGASGTSGTSGTAGDAGSAGTAGESGTSGTSGATAGTSGTGGSGGDSAMVMASDQTLTLSTVVHVSSVTALVDGWVSIHENDGGNPGAVIGFAPVAAGPSAEVEVGVGRRVLNGETLHAMLHIDAGVIGTFEFPGADAAENTATSAFLATVPLGTTDARIKVGTSGSTSYTFPVVESDALFSIVVGTPGDADGDNMLTLYRGWRYEIANPGAASHPLEFIHANATDDVLLSQQSGTTGTSEGTASVAWVESGNKETFTLSPELEAAGFDAYRCGVHTTMMRGMIMVVDEP